MDDALVALLRELVAIPSINPHRAPTLDEGCGEAAMADYVAEFLSDAGLDVDLAPVMPGRPNVVATLDGPAGGPPLLFVAHLDTVPVEGMTIPPFEGAVRDGRLYGRGACDNKGSMAAMLFALRRVAENATNPHPLLFAGTVDEEDGFSGVRAFLQAGHRAQAAFVGEPTGLSLVIAHRGATRATITATGKSAHSSAPERGVNAIYRMARVIAELEALAHQLGQRPPHPLTGPPTLSVGTIHGGIGVNTVPDRCTIELDRRLSPGETAQEAERALHEIAERHGATIENFLRIPALEMPRDADVVQRAVAAVEAVHGRADLIGAPYGTEAAEFAQAGIPAVVLGPGLDTKAHSADEFIPLDQLEAATRIYEHLMTQA